MTDSETNRTLPMISRRKDAPRSGIPENLPPVIDRRNLLPVTARLLTALIADQSDQRRESGPTPVREMWPRWYACHQQRVRATHLRHKLETEMLKHAGGAPAAELKIGGKDAAVVVHSFADINRLATQLNADQLFQTRAELRQRRRQWKEADERLGYSAALAREKALAERAGISGRVMWITRPCSVIEAMAKLHCLIVMHDPRLKLEGAPWPQLRTMLKDLSRLAGTHSRNDGCSR